MVFKRIRSKINGLAINTTYYVSDLFLLISICLFGLVTLMFVILFLYQLWVHTGFLGLLILGGGSSFLLLYVSRLLQNSAMRRDKG